VTAITQAGPADCKKNAESGQRSQSPSTFVENMLWFVTSPSVPKQTQPASFDTLCGFSSDLVDHDVGAGANVLVFSRFEIA
jgi:hypothetical protein